MVRRPAKKKKKKPLSTSHKHTCSQRICCFPRCDNAAVNTAVCTSHFFSDITSNRRAKWTHTRDAEVNGNAPPAAPRGHPRQETCPVTIHTFLSLSIVFFDSFCESVYFCLTRVGIMFQCLPYLAWDFKRSRRTKSPLITAEEPLCWWYGYDITPLW